MIRMPPAAVDVILDSIMVRDPRVVLEERRARWVQQVCAIKPGVSAAAIHRVSNMIIQCAFRIGRMSAIDPQMLAPFFLGVTCKWLIEGHVMDPDHLVDRLPTTVEGVGTMVVAEQINPLTGRRLTAADLAAAQKGGKLILN